MPPSPTSSRFVPGDEYAAQSGARGGADLGAHAAYAQHRAGDGDLAGHGRVGGDGFARDGRTHGHGHGKACRGAVHQRTAGKVDVYIVALDGDAHAGKRRARRLGGVARRAGSAEAVAAAIGDLLLRHHAGDAQLAMPRAGHGLGAQDSAHLRAGDGEGVHLPRHIAPRGARLAQARAARTGSDVFHVRAGDAAAPFLPRRGRRQLHEVDRRAGAVGVAGGQQGILPGQGAAGALGGVFRDLCQFLALQRAEEYLHAARAQGRGNVGGTARGGADEAKIGGQAVLKDVVDIGGRGLVPGVVIGAVEAHHAVFQHLEQLVHLHGGASRRSRREKARRRGRA